MMKVIIRLIDLFQECLETLHKVRGRMCIICFCLVFFGIFYTINNFANGEIKIEKTK